jgi:glutamyl-tRNA synthetase
MIVTRFAPSPTGYLHIGGARTALFNWLFSRHTGGKFLLRIEDTDRERSTKDAVEAIFRSLKWLGLDWDDEPVFQASRAERHRQEALRLLAEGRAYHCYASPEELQQMRETARAEGRPVGYDGRWRDRKDAPAGIKPVVRFKAPREGETIVRDVVQGDVRFQNAQLDDLVMLRSDGSPTYMLSVVVDDHDMGVTHVIRGDDHLTNAGRQSQMIAALGYRIPVYAHVPLIHGPDGTKLSKRHGAIGVEAYRDLGYLPEALRNYLARLGWAHGDAELFTTEQAISWFTLEAINKAPARLDWAKLDHVNGHYIRARLTGISATGAAGTLSPEVSVPLTGVAATGSVGDLTAGSSLVDLTLDMMTRVKGWEISADVRGRLTALMPAMRERAKTIAELAESAWFLIAPTPLELDAKAAAQLEGDKRRLLARALECLRTVPDWTPGTIEAAMRGFADHENVKLGAVAQPLRSALTGRTVSPPIFEVMAALGREQSLARIAAQATVT